MAGIDSIPPLRILQLIFARFIIFLALFLLKLVAMPQFFYGVPYVTMDNSSAGAPLSGSGTG